MAKAKTTGKGSALMKKMQASDALAEVLGRDTTSRAEAVKGIWKYIKENELHDGRMIHPDDVLAGVTGSRSFDMLKLPGFLSKHLQPL